MNAEMVFVILAVLGLVWMVWLAVYRPDLLKQHYEQKEKARERRERVVNTAADVAKVFIRRKLK